MNFLSTSILIVLSIVNAVPTPAGNDPGAVFRAKRTCPAPNPPAPDADPALQAFCPDLGASPGLQDPVCIASNGLSDRTSSLKPVKVPCDCPPAQADFARQFVIDHGSKIKTDNSNESKKNNIRLAIVTLQGGFCCPAASVTLNDQLLKL
ncbi:hypothetical protein HDV02_004973 [Globomyces sp. JEL0801]|nr:hypothetical protein HDV02_004973 [Globomyces sp. JEL0801]